MERRRPPLTIYETAAAAVLAVAVVVAAIALRNVYESWWYLLPAGFAAAVAATISIAARRFGWQVGPALLASSLGLLVVGSALVEAAVPPLGIPAFLRTVTRSWRLLLDVTPPLPSSGRHLAVPLVTGWAATAMSCELVMRTRSMLLPLAGPAVMLVVAVLFGIDDEGASQVSGVLLFVLAVGYLLLRSRTRRVAVAPSTLVARVAVVSGVLATAAAAPALADRLPLHDSRERVTLRDTYEPAFDPQRLASPLALVKESLVADKADTVMFTLVGPSVDRVRLAVLSEYDGVVFSMASRDRTAFRPIGATLPRLPDDAVIGAVSTHRLEVAGLLGPWIPVPGTPLGVAAAAGVEPDALRFDPADANVLSTEPLVEGSSFDITSRVVPVYSPDAGPPVFVTAVPAPSGLAAVADSVAGDAIVSTTRLERLLEWFARNGYFSPEVRPGHNAGRLEAFVNDDDGVVGYDEQYAATFALMARHLGLDARVVVGYEIAEWQDGSAVVTRGDLHAWNEIRIDGVGWMTIDITPEQPKEAEEDNAASDQVAGRLPEAPPVDDEQTPPTTVPEPDEDDDEAADEGDTQPGGSGGVAPAAVVGLSALGLVGAAALFGLLVVLLKWRRRRRRRRADRPHRRIAGAWQEFVDLGVDLGVAPSPKATIREQGAVLAHELAIRPEQLTVLVDTADRAGFDATEPSDADVELAWSELVRLERLAAEPRSWIARWRAAVRIRSLRAGRRARRRGGRSTTSGRGRP